jgi:hypothetical protein
MEELHEDITFTLIKILDVGYTMPKHGFHD